jgi:hypothetical protein
LGSGRRRSTGASATGGLCWRRWSSPCSPSCWRGSQLPPNLRRRPRRAHLAARRAAVRPALEPLAALFGEGRALSAARALTAFLHGFASIEQAGLFRLGGDVDAAFEEALAMVLDGICGASPRVRQLPLPIAAGPDMVAP